MFKRLIPLSLLALLATPLVGCNSSPQIEESARIVWDEQWNFDAYRITEGRGEVFEGAGKSYVILPGGIPAKQLSATGNPRWEQKGAVITIEGQPQAIHIQAEGGMSLKAERLETASLMGKQPAPAAGQPQGAVTTALADAPKPAASTLGAFPTESRK